ncbi:unnamed protein product [Mesocestoides corti]|nr:unnamed protein product [Mesocestoides corti]
MDIQEKIKVVRQEVQEGSKEVHLNEESFKFFEDFKRLLDHKINQFSRTMVTKHELLEEAKQQRDSENEKLAALRREKGVHNSPQHHTSPEEKLNASMDMWMNSRLGSLTFPDESHVLLDTSTSSILEGASAKPDNGARIRCHLKQPSDVEEAFAVDQLHPLGGSSEAMQVAQLATQAMAPSLLAAHVIWKRLSDAVNK